jgi:hypothetical protein
MTTRTIIPALLALLLATPGAALAQRLELDSLDRLADRASESVNIDLEPALLRMAIPFLKGTGNDQDIKALISDLKGIYVRVFEFDRDIDLTNEIAGIRKQLTSNPRWARLVGVDSKREGGIVEIYSWREGDASGGLAIIAAESNEITVVNIVGPFDPSRLPALRGLGVPGLR